MNCKDSSPAISPEDQKHLDGIKKLIAESTDHQFLDGVGKIWASNDEVLLSFIRARRYKLCSAFQRLLEVVRSINSHPEVFNKLIPSNISDALDIYGINILKNRDKKGQHILYFKADKWVDTNLVGGDDIARSMLILGWELLRIKETQLNGVTVIVDGRGFSFKHARQITPALVHRYLGILLKGNPLKIKAVHSVYAPRILDMSTAFIKMFLPLKLRNRLHVHGSGSMKSLHEVIDPAILPDWVDGHLSTEEAIDYDFYNGLYTQEKDDYYQALWCDNSVIGS